MTLAGVLAGCGSSSSKPEPPPAVDPPAATPPSIITQPASVSVAAGQQASFTVVVSGTAPFTYQWQRNGVDIAGASSATYDAPATSMGDTGASFTAIVANSAGSLTSAAAILTVTPPAGVTASVAVTQTTAFLTGVGQSTLLEAHAVDSAGAPIAGTVTWESSRADAVSVDSAGRITARSIGSALLFATANGVRSQPVFVFVAEPMPGALIVSDDQVIAVGDPIGLAENEAPGVGTRYEVTVSGIATVPAAGTVVLASGDQPVAGKLVSTRNEAGNSVLLLELAPLPEMLARYDLDWDIDLAGIPMAPIEIHDDPTLVGKYGKLQKPGIGRPPVLNKFEPFSCDAKIAVSLLKTDINLTPQIGAHLIVKSFKDDPSLTKGYGKIALVGSQALKGTVGIKLNAGFNAQATCIAQGQVKIPVGGVVSILVMPALRFGVGFEVSGQFVVASGELKATGTIGAEETLGFECDPLAGGCEALSDVTMIDDFKFVKTLPTAHDMHVGLKGQIFAVVGIDAVFGLVLFDAEIVEARVGPTQTFELAFPNDQAENSGSASNYHLDLDGVIQPGAALSKAIKKFVGDENVTLTFKAPYSTPLASSPKGKLTLSSAEVAYGEPVGFQVHLDNPLTYPLIGENGETAYNVKAVQIWRKKSGDAEFTSFATLTAADGQSTFQTEWLPASSDVGDYEFAAFVETQMPVPLLEITENSVKSLHVKGPGWSGTVTFTMTGTQTFTGHPQPGATQVVTVVANGSGEYRLETVADELGSPKLVIAEGTGTFARTRSTTYDRQYTFDDCLITQEQTGEAVEQAPVAVPAGTGWSLSKIQGNTYNLVVPGLTGTGHVSDHAQGSETSTGAPHCVATPPFDRTLTFDSQVDTDPVSLFMEPDEDPNVLAGTQIYTAGADPLRTYTVTYDLRRN